MTSHSIAPGLALLLSMAAAVARADMHDGGDAGAAADAAVTDAAVADAAVADAAVADAAIADAAVADAAIGDASVADAAVADAAVSDAAVVDAAVPDAAVADAGTPDAAVAFAVRIGAHGSGDVCTAPCRTLVTQANVPVTLTAVVQGAGEQGTSVLWDLVSRPQGSSAEIAGPTDATSTLTPDREGLYDIRLTGTDTQTGERSTALLSLRAERIAFEGKLVITVDGSTRTCEPECPRGSILIGQEVVADATGTTHDTTHGELKFSWTLTGPAGATAKLVDKATGVVAFRPDVDGAWEIRVRVQDSVDQEELAAAFVIPSAAYWNPPIIPECGQGPVHGGFPLAGASVVALAAVALARRPRRR